MSFTCSIQFWLTFFCYLFCGISVFNPLLGCPVPPIGFAVCIILSFTAGLTIFKISRKQCRKNHPICQKLIAVISFILCAIIILLIMTEVIRDACYISGRGVSKGYYLTLSLLLLGVCYFLCQGKSIGIFRFTFICVLPILLFILLCPLPFFTAKQVFTDFLYFSSQDIPLSFFYGTLSAILICADASVFIYCFGNTGIFDGISTIRASLIFVFSSLAAIFCSLCVFLFFGRELTLLLDDGIYALTKGFTGIDLTEGVAAIRIIAFIIKGSVYAKASTDFLRKAFCRNDRDSTIFRNILFCAIPTIYIPFLLFSDSRSYGSFQFLIYPLTLCLSLVFILINFFKKTK